MGIRMGAALLATVVLASCSGSDTGTNPTPDPDPEVGPLQVSLTPSEVVVEVGAIGQVAVLVSGGPEGAALDWVCLSDDPQIAMLDETVDGCRVTGQSSGTTSASVSATKGNTTAVAGLSVTVQEPPPPPPLQASLEPGQATLDEGHSTEMLVETSGGVSGAPVSWTCASSNVFVATVIVTAGGCEVTGEGPGEATITATVSKGSETTDATGQVTVLDSPFPPLQVFFEPASAVLIQAETTEMDLLILGGDPAQPAVWTCTVAEPEIAFVSVTPAGCEVTGFDAGSTMLTTVVTKGGLEKQAQAEITVIGVAGRSQENPAELNQPVTVIVDDPLVPWTKLRLTLLEVVTGTQAWQMALAWSPGNPGPSAGFEYIMGRFRIEVLSQADQGSAYQESLVNFESVSGTGTVHPDTGVCCNDPSPGQAGFTGAVWEGWADFLSETSDPLPKAVYRRGEPAEAWFELKPSP